MATQNTAENTEVINTNLEVDPEIKLDDADDAQLAESKDDNGETEELVVTIGDEEPLSSEDQVGDSTVIKELRKHARELAKRNRELEEKVNKPVEVAKPIELGDEPTLENCDYDEAKFKADWKAWNEKKTVVEKEAEKQKNSIAEANKLWQATVAKHETAKAELATKVKDFDEAEDVVSSTFSVTQRGIILEGSGNSALLMYALGKNPKKAKELASINSHVKFAFEVAKLETQLKTTSNKRTAPAPERKVIGGGARISGTVDSTLERLRNEAAKTGNMTKVIEYKNQLRAKAK